MLKMVAAMLALGVLPTVGIAQAPAAAAATADPALDAAVARLPALLTGTIAPQDYFAPSFLQAVPADQFRALTAQLIAQHGMPGQISARGNGPVPQSAQVTIAFERADVTMLVQTASDGRVIGLRIVDVAARNDSFDSLTADIAALPGNTGWGLYQIDPDGRASLLHGANAGSPMAIGSVFKLAILGTLDEEIAAGRMRWSDVVTLDRQSVPSGISIAWPSGAPMTLHTLATLMISQSDNRATDVLLHHLGREQVESFSRERGGLSGPNAFPLLSTLEATVLKSPGLGVARTNWLDGDDAQRRAVLAQFASQWTPADVDWSAFASGPADIDRIEWFASADSIAALLGWFVRSASDEARTILSVNPGIAPASAARWAGVGYKGGSEPGVVAMTLLLRSADGAAFVVSIAWNNPAAAVDEAQMATLATRAAALLRSLGQP
jgi:Beta-lactamase enzyme family